MAIKLNTQGKPAESPLRAEGNKIDNQGWSRRVAVAKKKKKILDLYEQGYTREDACRLVGVELTTWKYYRASDAEFRSRADLINAQRTGGKKVGNGDAIPTFEEFSEKYFGQRLFRHQLQWVDLIEGREPRDLHRNQIFVSGDKDTICVNTPPGHGKSTTLTMNYVTYRIVTDPNFRVVIVSKTEKQAKKFLQGIKRRLTNGALFRELIADYAPSDGFEKHPGTIWTSSMVYFGHAETGEKDPTVECLGIGQQIYGARADLIVIDDAEDLRNFAQVEDHIDWLTQEVMTRDARIFLVGTRVAPIDIYSEVLNPKRYADEEGSDWTYLSQPAILETAEDPEDWVTLWPQSNQAHSRDPGVPDENGLWDKWTGPRLARLRRKMSPRTWSLVYMQEQVSEDSVFPLEAITGSQRRTQGPGGWGNDTAPPYGREGFHVIAGLDPASDAGYSAAVVVALDRKTGKMFILDVRNAQLRPTGIRSLIMEFTEKYGVREWRVERNSFQAFLTQDREINQYLATRGVQLKEHQTQGNKWDPLWGVASMEMLFRGWQDKENLLSLPGRNLNEGLRTLIEQLVTWHPEAPKTQKTDTVMALWFAVIAARERTQIKSENHFSNNPFLSDNDAASRVVINIDDYLAEQRMAG